MPLTAVPSKDKISTHFYCGYCAEYLPRSEFSPNCNKQSCRKHNSLYDRIRADNLKKRVIEYMGGKCCRCGYQQCIAALELHHPNPVIKEMGWDKLRKRTFEFIIQHIEEQGLVLICANCHREEHYEEATLPQWVPRKSALDTLHKGQKSDTPFHGGECGTL